MLKFFFILYFLLIINCFAEEIISCLYVQEKDPIIKKMIDNLCVHIDFKIRFITNPEFVVVDDSIQRGLFVIIDKKNYIVLSPYNMVFQKIVAKNFHSNIATYHDFIQFSQSIELPNYSWLKQVKSISSLISSDVDHINNIFNMSVTESKKNVISLPFKSIKNNSLSIREINKPTDKIFDCNNIDTKIPLRCKIMSIFMCDSKYFNKNIKFISDITNVKVDKPIAEGFFVIINKKNDTAILPYNSIFKQLALLPKAEPYNFRNLFRFSKSLDTTAYAWLNKTNNISSLIAAKPYYAINMFTGTTFQMPDTNNTIYTSTQFKSKDKIAHYFIGLSIGVVVTSMVGFIYYKYFLNKKRKSYNRI